MKKRDYKSRKPDSSKLSDSDLEQQFLEFFREHYLLPTQQYMFHPSRAWKFDFCWPSCKLAIEIQGYFHGHNSYTGMSSDYEKHNAALLLGWRVLYFMSNDLDPYRRANTLSIVKSALENKCTT